MNYQQLLIALLQCEFGQERDLLKNYKSLSNASFILILERVAAQSKNKHPEAWAKIQYLLGLVSYYYLEDIKENYHKAIFYFNQALTFFSEANSPQQWATLQNYLGNVYRNLNKLNSKNKKVNASQAIACYQNALRIRKRDTFPEEYANTNYNLGVAYGMLADTVGEQDKANLLEKAKKCLAIFLDVTAADRNNKENWAETKIAVGALTQESSLGDKLSNLHEAVACYRAALEVSETKGEIPVVASALDYLGHGYRELSKYEAKIENLRKAYNAYQSALNIYSELKQAGTYVWAATQNDLGLVLIALGEIPKAIACFQKALEVFTPTTFPFESTRTGRNLGNAAYKNHLWQEAIAGYGVAIEAIEICRDKINSDEQRQAIIQEALDVYARMVEACVNSGTKEDLAKALETVERSRSRYLVDLIASKNFAEQEEISPELHEYLKKYEELQRQIDNKHSRYERNIKPDSDSIGETYRSGIHVVGNRQEMPLEVVQNLEQWESEKKRIWQQIRELDREFAGISRVEFQKIEQLQQLIDSPTTAILSFYSTFNHTYIFVLRQNSISYHLCDRLSREGLNSWLQENWFQPYQNKEDSLKKRWIANMESILEELATKLDLNQLVCQHLQDLEELIIVPHQLLHLIPFSALPLDKGEYLGDRFALRIVPSCQVLAFCQARTQQQSPLVYGTVVYSQQNLKFSRIEEQLIAWLYDVPENHRLREAAANRDNYHDLLHNKQVQGLLSSHHAQFNLANPLDSELILADSKLKLIELLTLKWRMKELNEVYLSCCETGLGEPAATDDLLTIAAGFLCSGARNVISSLWVVDDASTALLSFFYHQARKEEEGSTRSRALQQAQQRLRNLSDRDLAVAYENRKQVKEQKKQARNTIDYEHYKQKYDAWLNIVDLVENVLEIQRSQPLSHPFYWAAFTCQGLA
ncbi:MAG: CHAT domain-containing protein [Cyanobacteria bacterium P01_A01_bin.84]